MHKFILFFVFSILSTFSFGQKSEISFYQGNDLDIDDSKLLAAVFNEDLTFSQLLDAALRVGSDISEVEITMAKSSLDKFVDRELKGLHNPKKAEKSIAKISLKLQEKYLKVFTPQASLKDAIQVGEYNCVQFATIYAYVLDQLNIPFFIESDDKCIYLYAGESKILMSIPDITPSDILTSVDYQADYARELIELHVLDEKEYLVAGEQKIFDKYYNEPAKFSPRHILGLHFISVSSIDQQMGNFDLSFEHAKVANYLIPSYSVLGFALRSGLQALDNQDFSSTQGLYLMKSIYKVNPYVLKHEYVIGAASEMHSKMDGAEFKKAYQQLITLSVPDCTVNGLRNLYHELKSVEFYENVKLDSGYYHAKKAYSYSPKTTPHKLAFHSRFVATYEQKGLNTILEEMDVIFSNYPELNSNAYFQMLMMDTYLMTASERLTERQYSDAEKIIAKFETEYDQIDSELKPSEGNIMATYGQLATYYFSKNKISLAKETIDKALELYPENRLLQYKRKAIYGM